jgi:hypothetical protein
MCLRKYLFDDFVLCQAVFSSMPLAMYMHISMLLTSGEYLYPKLLDTFFSLTFQKNIDK